MDSIVAADSAAAAESMAATESEYEEELPEESYEYNTMEAQPVEFRSVDTVRWEEVTRDIDYSGDEQEERKLPKISKPGFSIPPNVVKICLYILIGAVLTYFIIYFLKNRKGSERFITDDEFFYSSEEKEIKKLNLDGMLASAIADKNYRLAIRIRYLIVIRKLSELRLIDWQKEKTNKDYLREVKSSAHFNSFAEITRQFNRVWYGDLTIDEGRYNILSPAFEDFMERLKNPVVVKAATVNTEVDVNNLEAKDTVKTNNPNSDDVAKIDDTVNDDHADNSNPEQQEA